MKIIGIDPGTTTTGIGIIEFLYGNCSLIFYDALHLNSRDSLHSRLKKIYDECMNCIKKYKPDEFAIETAFYGKNIQSTLKLGQARGVAIIAALNSNLNIAEYSPREIKKSVTGRGAASKEQVQYMVKSILSVKRTKITTDSSDAIAVALCHYYSLQNNLKRHATAKKENTWESFIEKNPEKILLRN
ncbi:MAG: Crossover junction endodeoxyribonuclease RuvC [Ignavibacteria bacterium]|nr:Crossover junction endodeoxyribonuclease RuvC [Ignavibacteria bacterium]